MALPDVTVSGKLTADPEPGVTPDGTALTRMSITAANFVKNDADQWVAQSQCSLAVIATGGYAEHAADSLRSGDLALIHGNLRSEPDGSVLLVARSVAVDLRFRTIRHSRDEAKAQPQN